MEEQQPSEVVKKGDSITIKKDTLWKVGTFVFAALFLITVFGGGFNFGGGGGGAGTGAAVAPNNPTPTAPTGNIKVPIGDDDPILGDPDAKISIVEFSDFQCPFCQRAHTGALADFRNSDYFKDGEVNLVYKHFPLNSIHPQAQKAAEASECARRQGGNEAFWEYHDILFANQNTMDVNSLKNYAQQVGLDSGEFNKCLDGNEARNKVSSDLSLATAAGGRGTPYFVLINNEDGSTQSISGAVPWSNFEPAINSLQ